MSRTPRQKKIAKVKMGGVAWIRLAIFDELSKGSIFGSSKSSQYPYFT